MACPYRRVHVFLLVVSDSAIDQSATFTCEADGDVSTERLDEMRSRWTDLGPAQSILEREVAAYRAGRFDG